MLYTYTSYTYVCIYACNSKEIAAMTLKDSKEEQMGGFRGRKGENLGNIKTSGTKKRRNSFSSCSRD